MNITNSVVNTEGGDTEQLPDAKAPPERQRAPNASETHWAQGSADGLQRPVPKKFSEIDESASSQAAASPSMEAVGKQAYQDAINSVDTDRGPVLDTIYNGPVTGGHRVGDKEKARDDRHHSDPARSKHP